MVNLLHNAPSVNRAQLVVLHQKPLLTFCWSALHMLLREL